MPGEAARALGVRSDGVSFRTKRALLEHGEGAPAESKNEDDQPAGRGGPSSDIAKRKQQEIDEKRRQGPPEHMLRRHHEAARDLKR